MKRLFIVFLFSFILLFSTKAEDQKVVYCEISGINAAADVLVYIDYGQRIGNSFNHVLLDKETGEKIKFGSMIDALNYMSKYGWNLVQVYERNGQHFYLLSKKITNDSEFMDGITTKNTLKEEK